MTGVEFLSNVVSLLKENPNLVCIDGPKLEINKEDLMSIYFYVAVENRANGKRKTAYIKYSDSISPDFVVRELLRALEN